MIKDLVREKGYLALGTRMKRLSDQLYSQVQQLIQLHDLPIQANHYPLLASLDENGPLTIGKLAHSQGTSQPGVTRIVGQLVKLGLVSARRGEHDQRQKVVELTDSGQVIVEQGRRIIWPQIVQCLSDIMDNQQGNFLEQLTHLEDALAEQTFLQRVKQSSEESQK